MIHPLNIISGSYFRRIRGGPYKVVYNTVKGLEQIGQTFVFNQPLKRYRLNWVHDSPDAFIESAIYRIPVLAGPNIFVLPSDFPWLMPKPSDSIYLHPSEWTIRFWKSFNFIDCRMMAWPAGIDTHDFSGDKRRPGKKVMVYFKKRSPGILQHILKTLCDRGYDPRLIEYGSYTDGDFKKVLNQVSFGIWAGTTESQGIAMLEALSTNLPLIVLNSTNILDNSSSEIFDLPSRVKFFRATSVPYFDERCGIVIDRLNQLVEALEELASGFERFSPREYILENLTLEKSANRLMELSRELDLNGAGIPYNYAGFKRPLMYYSVRQLHFIRRQSRKIIRRLLHRLKHTRS